MMRGPIRACGCLLAVFLLTAGLVPARAEAESAGWLGVFIGSDRPTATDASNADDAPPAGVAVRGVVIDGPAARAGLRARDRILEVDGVAVARPAELIERIGGLPPGSWVPLTVERDGAERTIRARLDERPEDRSGLRIRRGWVGLDAIDLPPSLRAHFGASDEAGVMVHAVEPYGPAWTAGVEVGDVIVEAAGVEVDSRRALVEAIAGGGVGNDVLIVAMRNGARVEFEARVEDADEARAEVERRLEERRR